MPKAEKTNAARLLARAGIDCEPVPFEVGPDHLAAAEVARQLGEPVSAVYKTLVLRGDRTGMFVCVVPADHAVDLKAAARVSGNKRAELIPVAGLLAATGYVRGGCSPVGMKKRYPTFFHASVLDRPYIYVSAGIRGMQLRLRPADLVAFVEGRVEPIARPEA